jgi:hypothetical protein
MAIALDAVGAGGSTSSSTSLTISHTAASGATVIVWVLLAPASTPPSVTATHAGNSMTQPSGSPNNFQAFFSYYTLACFYLTGAGTGSSQNIVITDTSATPGSYIKAGSISYTGVGSVGSLTVNTGSSTSLSVSASSASGRLVVNALMEGYNGGFALSSYNQTLQKDLTSTGAWNTQVVYIGDAAGAGTVTFSATTASAVGWGAGALDLIPPANITCTPTGATIATSTGTPGVALPVIAVPTGVTTTATGGTPTVTVGAAKIPQPGTVTATITGGVPGVSLPVVCVPGTVTVAATEGLLIVDVGTAPVTVHPTSATPTISGGVPLVVQATPRIVAPTGATISSSRGAPIVNIPAFVTIPTPFAGSVAMGAPIVTVVAPGNITAVPTGATITATGGALLLNTVRLQPTTATAAFTGGAAGATGVQAGIITIGGATLTVTRGIPFALFPAPTLTTGSLPAARPVSLLDQMTSGDLITLADAAERLAKINEEPDPTWTITLHDKFWRPIGEIGDFIEADGTDPRNALPSATLKLKGNSEHIPALMNCRNTLVGITVETQGLRFPYYVDVHEYELSQKGEWTSTSKCNGIWDILNYLQVWPDWFLPIQAQIFSHAVFIGPVRTCIECMIAECALRIQSGLWEFVNNALSLDPDVRAWFGTLLQSNGNIVDMLKTPLYVVLHNPLLDGSPLVARTVRMESCAAVLKDMTKAYGIDVRVDLWLPGDSQPDHWANLDQPTYVVTVTDRSQITGPTQTILDSVVRTFVDIEGSLLGNVMAPILNPGNQPVPENLGMFTAPTLGVNFVPPWVVFIAPEPGDVGSVMTCKIVDHTPKGWQHIIGGKSPQWLNDLINVTFSWIIDAISILIGVTGIPSDLLAGFLNDAFLAFQLIESYDRRNAVGPYHPAIEVFHATSSAPYNIETVFGFINALWDSRGWTCAQLTFRNGDVYTLGRDIFRGQLASVVYMGRTKILTDFVENTTWRIDPKARDVITQIGDGKAIESPLAKQQRLITGALEAINVLTLAPQSG